MKTIEQFVKENQIKIKSERVSENPSNPEWRDADHWKSVLRMKNKQMTVYFSKGYGHNGKEPSTEEVLDCLVMDSDALDYDFEEWADNLGYDTDSRKAEKTYKACAKQATKLQNFLGDLFDELQQEVERM